MYKKIPDIIFKQVVQILETVWGYTSDFPDHRSISLYNWYFSKARRSHSLQLRIGLR